MTPLEAYKYCPNCGKEVNNKNQDLFKCPGCGFQMYDNPRPTINVVIENKNKGILLAKRIFEPYKGYWDIPGGFIQTGETWQEAAKREISEELGIDVDVKNIFTARTNEYEYSGITYPVLSMFTFALTDAEPSKVADDVSDFKFVSRKKILQEKLAWEEMQKSVLKDYLALDRHLSTSA